MRRATLNFLIDLVSLLAMFALIGTGLIMRFVLPPGSRGGGGLALWSMGRHDWGDVHFWIACGIGALLLVHVALHWSWVCSIVRRWFAAADGPASSPRSGMVSLTGLAFLVVVAVAFGSFLKYASAQVESGKSGEAAKAAGVCDEDDPDCAATCGKAEKQTPEPGKATKAAGALQIRGSMTLGELEKVSGVPVADMIKELGLPKDVTADERIGRLRRVHDVEVDEIRDVITRHAEKQKADKQLPCSKETDGKPCDRPCERAKAAAAKQ